MNSLKNDTVSSCSTHVVILQFVGYHEFFQKCNTFLHFSMCRNGYNCKTTVATTYFLHICRNLLLELSCSFILWPHKKTVFRCCSRSWSKTRQGRLLAPFMYKVCINGLLTELIYHSCARSLNNLSLPLITLFS